MISRDGLHERLRSIRERLKRETRILALERLSARIRALSLGDRALLYLFAGLVVFASLLSFLSLQRALLVEVPTYGGSLVEGELGSPQFINPLLAISDADRDLSILVYAGLMGLSSSGELVPVLAERYEMSPDGKVYTFTLREDVLFSDGSPVTSDDVVFTVRKAQDPGLKSPEYANWSGVSVSADGPSTVRFTLARPYAPFLALTTLGILPSRLWSAMSNEEFPFSTLQTNPVGAGPFKVAGVSRDAAGLIRRVELTANRNFVLGRPYLDSIRFIFFSRAEDLSTAVKNNEVESAYGVATPRAITAPYARIFGVFWNPGERAVYARADVRKALSLVLDRDAIVADVLAGYATPILGPVPPGQGIPSVSIPVATDRLRYAADILEKAGWEYDGTARAWKHASAKLSLDSITLRTSNVPELKNVASAVKRAWEEFGITVDIELYEPGDLSQNVIRPRKYEALLYGMVVGRDQDLYAFWDSKERNDPGLNIAQYANKTVDELLERIRSVSDKTSRNKDLERVQEIIAGEYPAAFIYAPDFIYTIPSDLQGVKLPQIVTPSDRFIHAATWYKKTDRVWPFFADRQ